MSYFTDTVFLVGKVAVLSIASISFMGTLTDIIYLKSIKSKNHVEQTFSKTFSREGLIEVFNKERNTDQNIMYAFSNTNAVVIKYGRGGAVKGMIHTLEYMKINPSAKIIIDGPCMSACTLLLNLPDNQVKFTEKADFGFHTSYYSLNGYNFHDNKMNRKMLSLFNPAVQDWIIKSKAYNSLDISLLPRNILYSVYPNKLIKSTEIPILEYINEKDEQVMIVKE